MVNFTKNAGRLAIWVNKQYMTGQMGVRKGKRYVVTDDMGEKIAHYVGSQTLFVDRVLRATVDHLNGTDLPLKKVFTAVNGGTIDREKIPAGSKLVLVDRGDEYRKATIAVAFP